MKEIFRKDLLGFKDKTIRTLFLIGLIISLILTPLYIITVKNSSERKLERYGEITDGTVIGFASSNKSKPEVAYQFLVEDKVYYGTSDYQYEDTLVAGDSIKIKYIVDKPDLNKMYIDAK